MTRAKQRFTRTILLLLTLQAATAATRYVDVNSPNPTPPFTDWATAAKVIQDAVDVAAVGDEVLVTNGVYTTGGRAVVGSITNRVAVTKPLTLRSVHGPAVTIIEGFQVPGTTNGDGAIRCVYLADGAALSGFKLTKGATRLSGDLWEEQQGGGVQCASATALVSNCILTGNSASLAGGAHRGTLENCILMANSALSAGGASGSRLYNCTVTMNAAQVSVGGVYFGFMRNSICYYNTDGGGGIVGPNHDDTLAEFSCITPVPSGGVGNTSAEPAFMNRLRGDLRLRPDSPCIDAGSNAYVSSSTDLDGNPRIVGGTVEMGAYEFQTATWLLFRGWLEQHGLPTDGSADFTDNDTDLLNNWQEWHAGTIPTNALSVLRLRTPIFDGTNLTVTWDSVLGRSYFLERSAEISDPSAFRRFATSLPGQASTTSFLDTNAVGDSPRFYRVGVE